MEGGQLDFVGKRHRRGGAARRLGAMAAPVAAHGGAVVDDPSLLRYAELVIGAFGQGDIEHGLTRAQIVERASRTGEVDLAELDRRLDTFVDLAMLLPYHDKAHQQRYVVSTDAVAGSLFFRKGLSEGGIEELLQLLGATADAIEAGRHDPGKVAEALVEQRGYVEMWTAAVNWLTDTSTLGELLAERAQHDGDRMLTQVERVVDMVSRHHPSLRISAAALLTAAQGYLVATQRLLERIIDEGASTRDFSLLDPAEYARLATTGTVEELAAVFGGIVWDPARPAVSPTDVVAALRTYSPRHRHPRRPPIESPSNDAAGDPLDGIEERMDVLRRQREHAAELLLQGQESAELSATLRASPWPSALRVIVELSSLDADRRSTYRLHLADSIIIDVDAHTTWTSDASLKVERPRLVEEAPSEDPVQELQI